MHPSFNCETLLLMADIFALNHKNNLLTEVFGMVTNALQGADNP
jgi:hypothetical protein